MEKHSILEQIKRLTAKKKEELIGELALELYSENRGFRPMFPWVFVRIVPKEQMINGLIIVPELDQNKTIHEGIVLTTWQPFEKTFKNGAHQKVESALKPGDHVLLNHWSGLPVAGFSDKHYRMVKEIEWSSSQEGGIFASVEYGDKNTKPIERLKSRVTEERVKGARTDEEIIEQLFSTEFLLVDHSQGSVTLSGR